MSTMILTKKEVEESRLGAAAKDLLLEQGRSLSYVVAWIKANGASEVFAKALVVAIMTNSYLR